MKEEHQACAADTRWQAEHGRHAYFLMPRATADAHTNMSYKYADILLARCQGNEPRLAASWSAT